MHRKALHVVRELHLRGAFTDRRPREESCDTKATCVELPRQAYCTPLVGMHHRDETGVSSRNTNRAHTPIAENGGKGNQVGVAIHANYAEANAPSNEEPTARL